MYNYRDEMKADIRSYIENRADLDADDLRYNRAELQENLYEDMFIADEITGNASGSYTCNAWEAEECLCHNLDLLRDACYEFGADISRVLESAETADVTIRCYLLGECLEDVLDEIEEEFEYED